MGDTMQTASSPVLYYTIDEAAERMRISRRQLEKLLRQHPYCTNMGTRKRFLTNDHIERLVKAREEWPLKSSNERAPITGTSAAPSEVAVCSKLRELATGRRRKR